MAASFSPTPAELTLVSQIFAQADPQKLGVVTGDAAVKLFDGAKLNPSVLGEIWNIADEENKGWLAKRGVAIAVRLLGWAQKGEKITAALLSKPGPLPKIEGVNIVSQQNTGMSLPKSPPTAFPPLSQQDRTKFQGIFLKAGPANGLLSGDKARDIFVKSKLSNDLLLQIWNLADTQDRGSLDSTDFAIGMYFIQGLMSGKFSFIPTSLPPGLYQQAGGGGSSINQSSVLSHLSGNSGSFSPVSNTFPVQQHYTGQAQALQPNHTGMSNQSRAPSLPARPAVSSPFNPPIQALPWEVTSADKANSDRYFDNLDSQKRGYIEGDVAVPFMLESKLPGEVLAQVWDLADINNNGRLTRDGFAVAMHLIQKRLAGIDVPSTLPPSLIPPSMRSNATPIPSAFSTPANTLQQPEPPKDLFSFDDTPPPSAVTAQPTGGFIPMQSQQTGSMTLPFPQSSTGRLLALDPFSASVPTTTSAHHDFLGDDEPSGTVPPLHDQSAEIGNVKNQLTSTSRSLEATKAEGSTLEQTLANQASQLSALQTQLSSAKAAYETEVKLLATLKSRHTAQASEIQKAREELIRAESDLSAVKVEKAEIEGSFLRDKEDARELHRQMVEVGREADTIKTEVEKLKKEAKQQKGLLAIARKQLSSKEAERVKAEKEREEADAELSSIVKEKVAVDVELSIATSSVPDSTQLVSSEDSLGFAAGHLLPVSPDPASPAVNKRNNPFERLALSGGSTSRAQSPYVAFQSPVLSNSVADLENANVEDDIFGFGHQDLREEPSHSTEGLAYDQDPPSEVKGPLTLALSNGIAPTVTPALSPATANESEFFSTPPTSAKNISSPSLDTAAQFPPIDDIASHFPDVENIPTENLPVNGHHDFDTAFSSQLQENDIDESDSDSDDEVPLAELAQSASKQSAIPTLTKPEDKQANEIPTNTATNTESFDSVFGAPATIASQSNPSDLLSPPAKKHEPQPNASATPFVVSDTPTSPTNLGRMPNAAAIPAIAGVDAFDEALGKIPASASTPFSFDAAFEDNFDFAAASSDFPTVASQSSQSEIHSSDFNNIFSLSTNGHSVETPAEIQFQGKPSETLKPEPTGLSFDEAFSGIQPKSAPSLEFDNTVIIPAHLNNPVPVQVSEPIVPGSFPVSASPVASKPVLSPRAAATRPVSPATRPKSPPRVASPKHRVSSSSSKESHDKVKESTARHSKLSIRLPFGRKKKPQEPMPPPPVSHLSPPLEQLEGTVMPAVDDDVEPVKQLTAMGFSRTQAIVALEKYDYDVQKALNSLLGGQ